MNIYNEAFVYKWTNLTNNYIYIGYHKGPPDDGYICSSKSDRFWKDFNDPAQPFKREILAFGSCAEMIALEKQLLRKVNIQSESVYNNGINGVVFTDEVRQKMSAAGKKKRLSEDHKRKISEASKKFRHSPETKAKMSERMTGEQNPMFRKKFSDEHKRRLSEAQRARPVRTVSDEARKKMSQAQLGVKRGEPTPTHKANLSAALKGIFWITNGTEVKGVKSKDLIPDGWYLGRPKKKTK